MPSKYSDPSISRMFMDAVWDIAGEEGVCAVQLARGGTQVTVPRRPKSDHWLCEAIGVEKANAVCRSLWVLNADNQLISYPRTIIPLGFAGLLARTLADVDRRLMEGQSARKIAVQIGISERTIWRRRARLVEEGKLERVA